MGKIFYLMGKSASGKDTIYRRLRADCPFLRPVVLYTTRPMRRGETGGAEYYFVDEAKIEELRASGQMIESRTYHTMAGPWIYATVDDGQFDISTSDYLMIGTLESYERMQNYFGASYLVPLYIVVDDGIRLQRALARERQQETPDYAEVCRRYLADEKDFSPENLIRLGVFEACENENLESCLRELEKVIARERADFQ